MLARVLADVRTRIAKRSKLNENDTKATLIEPVLAALGWDVHDVEEVAREHKAPRGKPVDYALLVMREPKLYLEAKALGEDLNDSRFAEQIMTYAVLAGVEWTVLTNGNEWRIYNSHATVPIAEKLLRSVKVSDSEDGAEEILALLSKDQLQTKLIDAMWRAQFVDRKVRAAIDRFFDPDHDMTLVNHVGTLAKDLSADEIRGSMRRCKVALDFPLSPSDMTKAARSMPGKKQRGSTKLPWKDELGYEVTPKHLVDSKLVTAPLKLFREYKGTQLEAIIQKDGTVKVGGEVFNSLSQAGSAARATVTGLREDGSMRATNGWTFWRYRTKDGREADVDELRTEYRTKHSGKRAREA